MILRHLDINGYHCYKETGFDFAKEVTVLIGKTVLVNLLCLKRYVTH